VPPQPGQAVHEQTAELTSDENTRRDKQIETIIGFVKTHSPRSVDRAQSSAAAKTKGSKFKSGAALKRLVSLPKGPLYDVRIRRDVPLDKNKPNTRADFLELEIVKDSTLVLFRVLNSDDQLDKTKTYTACHPSFDTLMKQRPTTATFVKLFGKLHQVPRDVLTMGQNYSYSGQNHAAVPIPDELQPTFHLVESWIRQQGWAQPTKEAQTDRKEEKLALMGLVNYYIKSGSKIGAHSDDEREINPSVVVSYVAMSDPAHSRTFRIRDKTTGEILLDIGWPDQMWGAMLGEFQSKLKHEVPWFSSDEGTQRINLTVRVHKSSSFLVSSSSSSSTPSRKRKQPTADETPDSASVAVIPRPTKRAHVSSSASTVSTS
jgi:alkylated DNA repair dioxygenase AlkB